MREGVFLRARLDQCGVTWRFPRLIRAWPTQPRRCRVC